MVAGGELLNCVAEFLEYAGGFKGLVENSGISGRIPQGFRGIPEQFDRGIRSSSVDAGRRSFLFLRAVSSIIEY